MRFRSLNAQAVGHVHGQACLPWVFELAGKYGINEALHKTGNPTAPDSDRGSYLLQNVALVPP